MLICPCTRYPSSDEDATPYVTTELERKAPICTTMLYLTNTTGRAAFATAGHDSRLICFLLICVLKEVHQSGRNTVLACDGCFYQISEGKSIIASVQTARQPSAESAKWSMHAHYYKMVAPAYDGTTQLCPRFLLTLRPMNATY
jgi:hypothetical protein